MNKLRIKGLLFDNIDELFISAINSVFENSEKPKEELERKIVDNYEKIIKTVNKSLAKSYLQFNKFNLEDFVRSDTNNRNKIISVNKSSFTYFLIYINTCYIIYEKGTKVMQGKRQLPSVVKICMSLYGLILRRVDQIVSMLFDGYIDGAMIIWRSMYEYVITMMVIALEDDNSLADKYYAHSVKNSKKKVESYTKHHKELKFKPLSKRTHKNIQIQEEKTKNKYGKEFISNEYGWADYLFEGKIKASLRLLEDRVGMQRYRLYYLMCTEHSHSNFNGFKTFMIGNKIMLDGLHDREINNDAFVDPMQFTLAILNEVTDYILFTFSTENEYDLNSSFLNKTYEAMQKTFNSKKN